MDVAITLTPAYGRDYKNFADALADLNAGKDFIVNQWGSRWDGKPANLEQLRANGVTSVNLRFNKLRYVTPVAFVS